MRYKERNDREIALLDSVARMVVTRVMHDAWIAKLDILITDGKRTNEEQARLWRQGRETPGIIVTKARGGWSKHNYGVAIDIVPVGEDGRIDYGDSETYHAFAKIAKKHGMEWGRDWVSFRDTPHFEYTQGHGIQYFRAGGALSLAELPLARRLWVPRFIRPEERIKRLRRALLRLKGSRKERLQRKLNRLLARLQ